MLRRALLTIVVAFLAGTASAQAGTEHDRVMSNLEHRFGKPVAYKGAIVFPITRSFFVEPVFTDDSSLEGLAFDWFLSRQDVDRLLDVTKPWYQTAPFLSESEYARWLYFANELRSLGDFQAANDVVSIGSSGAGCYYLVYSKALVVVIGTDLDTYSESFRTYSFSVRYPHLVRGIVEKRELPTKYMPASTVRIGRSWYVIAKSDFARLVDGKEAAVRAIGPISDHSLSSPLGKKAANKGGTQSSNHQIIESSN